MVLTIRLPMYYMMGQPASDGNQDGAYLVTMLGGGKQFLAFAYCFDNQPLRP